MTSRRRAAIAFAHAGFRPAASGRARSGSTRASGNAATSWPAAARSFAASTANSGSVRFREAADRGSMAARRQRTKKSSTFARTAWMAAWATPVCAPRAMTSGLASPWRHQSANATASAKNVSTRTRSTPGLPLQSAVRANRGEHVQDELARLGIRRGLRGVIPSPLKSVPSNTFVVSATSATRIYRRVRAADMGEHVPRRAERRLPPPGCRRGWPRARARPRRRG